MEKPFFAGNKTFHQRFGAKEICSKFLQKMDLLCLHQNPGQRFYSQQKKLFAIENVKNEDFNQRLECASLKRWSKYTTITPKQNQDVC